MTVWLINQFAIPPTEAGGTRHYALARQLRARGHDVRIVASNRHYATRQPLAVLDGERYATQDVGGVPFLWIQAPATAAHPLARLYGMLVFAFNLYRTLRRDRFGQPDVIVGSSPSLFAAFAAERLAARYAVPFVLEVRDLWPQTIIDIGKVSARHPLVKGMELLERYLYRKARRIILLLPGAALHIAEKGGDPTRTMWIPNGVDLDGHQAPAAPDVERDTFTVLYAGAHGTANALDALVETARLVQHDPACAHVRFRFIGDGPDKARLQRLAQEQSLRNVTFEPPIPKARLFGTFHDADAFIVTLKASPNLYRYGISLNKLYDYLAAGRPIVFGTNSLNDPVQEAGAGVSVPPEDAQAMAAAVGELAHLPAAERQAMGQRGYRYVQRRHAFERLAVDLEAVLQQAVTTHRTAEG